MESLLKNPHDEARARILWGESWVEVHHWLIVEGGLTEEQAEVIIEDIRKERMTEVRRSGLRSLRSGLAFLLVGGAAASWSWQQLQAPTSGPVDRFEYWMFALGVVATLWGLHLCLKGLSHLFTGRAEGSLTEMD